MSQKRVKMFQVESLRLSINEHMASVREDISCVVNDRLNLVEQFMCSLFQREMETLATLLERRDERLDVILQPRIKLHKADQCVETSLQVEMCSPQPSRTVSVKLEPEEHLDTNFLHLPVYKEEVSPEQQESSPSLVQEEPEPPHIKEEQEELLQRPEEADGSTLTSLLVKSEGDDVHKGTEPVASTSTEHMQTQADVDDCGTLQSTCNDQLLSSHHSESDITEDSDEWEEETRVVKMFSNKIHLKKHMMTHAGGKPFTCTVCGKGFSQKYHLKMHVRTHTGEKPFICTVCGKGHANTGNLKTHMMTHTVEKPHTGEKPFICAFCGKGHVNTCNLKTHMMTHTGEWPFTCTVCGKGFSKMTHLKIHMRIHTGEKPFVCAVCGKCCAQKSNLKTHMRRMHAGEKSFTVCGDN